MTYKVDVHDEHPVEWHLDPDGGATPHPIRDYHPRLYVGVRDGNDRALRELRDALAADPKVHAVSWTDRRTDLRADATERVLRVDADRVREAATIAREIRAIHEPPAYAPGTYEVYNVDFSPQFRYCLETDTDPTPRRDLRRLAIDLPEKAIADRDIAALRVDGDRVARTPADALDALTARLHDTDPDLLVLNTAQLVPVLHDAADAADRDAFALGRRPGWRQLAGESTFESYGRIGHSPARYDVPGRAILDRSNSFLWGHAGLPGVLDLVERSWKPVQEAGWASIGNVLTAIQIREAMQRGVLVPWKKAAPEAEKDVRTLHAADRGGFTFQPDVGLHEGVRELDFSSLYPNIMIEYNVSPDTVRCACHRDRDDVPDLGYAICDDDGFIPDVLGPIVEARDRFKRDLERLDADAPERDALEARSEALKWILVTCFGYQGYKNSKFGRIEAHEAINAYARDILLRAKDTFEAAGWRVVHGIVDSIWVRPAPDGPRESLDAVAARVTDDVGIRLEHERDYDWLCFVPRRDADAGALTKYFGKVAGEDAFKVRGVELRQRSTPAFVADAQRAFMETLDRERDPAAVTDRLARSLATLRAGDVPPEDLVIRNRTSKPLEAYTQATRTVAALHRYRDHGIEKAPGQDVTYVVVDDDARLPERVRLPFEAVDGYDAEHYAELLLRACESVVSPLGWDRDDIRRHLRGGTDVGLAAFG